MAVIFRHRIETNRSLKNLICGFDMPSAVASGYSTTFA
jgi:hypothetical protein